MKSVAAGARPGRSQALSNPEACRRATTELVFISCVLVFSLLSACFGVYLLTSRSSSKGPVAFEESAANTRLRWGSAAAAVVIAVGTSIYLCPEHRAAVKPAKCIYELNPFHTKSMEAWPKSEAPARPACAAEDTLEGPGTPPRSRDFRRRKPEPTWAVDVSDINICTQANGTEWLLGVGSLGQVYRGIRAQKEVVAVKLLHSTGLGAIAALEAGVERVVALPPHRNVARLLGASLEEPRPILVSEYMIGGNLRDALCASRANGKPSFLRRGLAWALDITRGLAFLHAQGLAHGNLKAQNVLLDGNCGTAKLCDIGIGCSSPSVAPYNSVVTLSYAAPEKVLGRVCGPPADIYALGVLLWEIVTCEIPCRGQLRCIKAPEECHPAVADLVDACLNVEPASRPTAVEVFQQLYATIQPAQARTLHLT